MQFQYEEKGVFKDTFKVINQANRIVANESDNFDAGFNQALDDVQKMNGGK